MTKERIERITESTLIPISVLGILAVTLLFIGGIYHQGNANASSLADEVLERQRAFDFIQAQRDKDRTELNEKLTRIEDKSDRILDTLARRGK